MRPKRRSAKPPAARIPPEPSPPAELEAHRIQRAGEEYAVLRVRLPEGGEPPLSEAEHEVLQLLLTGASRPGIATQRGTSRRTVAHQVASLFRTPAVESRSELAGVHPLLRAR